MYPYAFFSRILAVVVLLASGLVCLPTTIQYFRLSHKVNEAQTQIQNAGRAEMVMRNLVPQLAMYAQQDPSILPLLQKYGISPPPSAQAPAPKPRKK
jgi:hypothetical protein